MKKTTERNIFPGDVLYVVTVGRNDAINYAPRIVVKVDKRGILFESNSGEGYWKFGKVKYVLGQYKFLDEMDPMQRAHQLAIETARGEAIWRLNELAGYLPVEEYMRKHRMTLAQLGREIADKLVNAVDCFPDSERNFNVEVKTRV